MKTRFKGIIEFPAGAAVIAGSQLKGLSTSKCEHCSGWMDRHEWAIMDDDGRVIVMCSEEGPKFDG